MRKTVNAEKEFFLHRLKCTNLAEVAEAHDLKVESISRQYVRVRANVLRAGGTPDKRMLINLGNVLQDRKHIPEWEAIVASIPDEPEKWKFPIHIRDRSKAMQRIWMDNHAGT